MYVLQFSLVNRCVILSNIYFICRNAQEYSNASLNGDIGLKQNQQQEDAHAIRIVINTTLSYSENQQNGGELSNLCCLM
jgi:hypothetical protein